ncbi:MAC/perforin domain-containing protein [Streptomyces sp. NPDC050538]|uniref:MAC/perforin domain-containing protein n=1 Tax=Streptomyces sp. NPDC050538 TaxID=3365627 RepID=UPI00379CDB17
MINEPTVQDLPFLSQANALGQGFDVYGVYGAESLLRPIFDLDDTPTSVFTFLGRDYQIPSIVRGVQDTSSTYNSGTFTSREGFQSKVAVFAGVEGKYGEFSGELKAAFATDYARSSEYYYSFKNFYTRLGHLQLNPDTTFLTADFSQAVGKLPDTVTAQNLPVFADFFAQFGGYYTSQVSLGASLEFYNGVSKSTTDTVAQISAMLEVQYTGVFSSGSISAGILASKEWKSYAENSTLSIATTGGDAIGAAHLQSIDARNPSAKTVDAFNGWLETISDNPAVSEYKLNGIWNVCGDKKSVVQQAWVLFGRAMHPRITIEATSPAAQAPTITLGYQVKPSTPPDTLSGWQMAILDRRDVSTPSKVVFDRYYTFDRNWPASFQKVYQTMARDIRESGQADENHILVACAFGLNYNCSPNSDFYGLLRSAGGGEMLQRWVQNATPGSSNANNACYALIGVFDEGADSGLEAFSSGWDKTARLNLDAYFYRLAYDKPYTFGPAPLSTEALPAQAPAGDAPAAGSAGSAGA